MKELQQAKVLATAVKISKNEIDRTYIYSDDIHIRMDKNPDRNKLDAPYNSRTAEKMTETEIKELIEWK